MQTQPGPAIQPEPAPGSPFASAAEQEVGAAFWREAYRDWLVQHAAGPQPAPPAFDQLAYRPIIALLIDLGDADGDGMLRTIRSILDQSYPKWRLTVVPRPGLVHIGPAPTQLHEIAGTDPRISFTVEEGGDLATRWAAVLAAEDSEFAICLRPGDELRPYALAVLVGSLNRDPDADVVYSDHDCRLPDGEIGAPFFKPAWSPTLLTAFNYLRGLVLYRGPLLLQALLLAPLEVEAADYDLALRVTERTTRIRHIAFPLSTLAEPVDRLSHVEADASRRVLSRALVRRGEAASVEAGKVRGTWRIRRTLANHPRVTIIIPTKDKLELLQTCIETVITGSSYRNFDIMIIDNQSCEPATLDYLARFPGTVYRYPHPFNYARMMNLAARKAGGDLLLFLNNDIEVLSNNWLEVMIEQCQRPEVGIVGIRLLYPDGSVHHEGITVGRSGPTVQHIDFDGYHDFGVVAREVSAITGACLMMKPEVFRIVGGFDERMAVGYNDVDLCLRTIAEGYAVIYTGFAELSHVTSATRGSALPLKDEWFFLERWPSGSYTDPFLNPNLTWPWPVRIT